MVYFLVESSKIIGRWFGIGSIFINLSLYKSNFLSMSAGIVFLYFSNDEGTNIKDKTLRIFELIKIFELAKTMPQLCFEIIF